MKHILAIDTSTAWCSAASSLGDAIPLFRHELVSAGASQLVLPWVEELLKEANLTLKDLAAIAVGIGPGAFTGVRLGVAVVQGLAVSCELPILPVTSLDAIASQTIHTTAFKKSQAKNFVIAIDARMDEIYWAKYETSQSTPSAIRIGDIHLSKPEEIDLSKAEFFAGNALKAYGDRLFANASPLLPSASLDPDMNITALGILDCARQLLNEGRHCDVRYLEPMYVRNKVALTTVERQEAYK